MILASIAKIHNYPLRGLILTFWFPVELAKWLWVVLLNDPRQLFTVRPYSIARGMFLLSMDGAFLCSAPDTQPQSGEAE